MENPNSTNNTTTSRVLEFVPCPEYVVSPDKKQTWVFEATAPLKDPPKPKFDKYKYLDSLLFGILIIVGLIIAFTSNDFDAQEVFGNMLYGGGLTPLIISMWALMTGATMFKRINIIKGIVAGSFFIVGVLTLYYVSADGQAGLFGMSLFSIGALFFISKFFFLTEDAELRIERLEKEIEEAKRSPGAGMALSYFYNFVLPTAAHLRSQNEENGITPVTINNEEYSLQQSQMLIFVPRNLDGSDIKQFLSKIQNEKLVVSGKPKEKALNSEKPHRPMFVYFLHSETSDGKKICNGMFDIPTIISSSWDRSKDPRFQNVGINIPQEILDFQNNLITLVNRNPLSQGKVKIVSVPSTPLQLDVLKQSANHVGIKVNA